MLPRQHNFQFDTNFQVPRTQYGHASLRPSGRWCQIKLLLMRAKGSVCKFYLGDRKRKIQENVVVTHMVNVDPKLDNNGSTGQGINLSSNLSTNPCVHKSSLPTFCYSTNKQRNIWPTAVFSCQLTKDEECVEVKSGMWEELACYSFVSKYFCQTMNEIFLPG